MVMTTAESKWRGFGPLAFAGLLALVIGSSLWFSETAGPAQSEDPAARSPTASEMASISELDQSHGDPVGREVLPTAHQAGNSESGPVVEFVLNEGVGDLVGIADVTLAPGKGTDLEIVDGRFSLPWEVIKGSRQVEVIVLGFVVFDWRPPEVFASPVHIQLSPAGSVAVKVLDEHSHPAPFVDVAINVSGTGTGESRCNVGVGRDVAANWAHTDENGECVIDRLPPGAGIVYVGGFGEWDGGSERVQVLAEEISRVELQLDLVSPYSKAVLEIQLADLPHAEVPLRAVKHYFVRSLGSRNKNLLYTSADGRAAVAAIQARGGTRVEIVSEKTGEVAGPYDLVAGERYALDIEWRPVEGDVEFVLNQAVGSLGGRVELRRRYTEPMLQDFEGGKFYLPWKYVTEAVKIEITVPGFAVYRWHPPETFSTPVHIQLPQAGSVAVRVFDERAQAVPSVRVVCGAIRRGREESRCNVGTGQVMTGSFAMTDESGMCVIEHVPIGLCQLAVPACREFALQKQSIEVTAQRIHRVDLGLEFVDPEENAIVELDLSALRRAKLKDGWVEGYRLQIVGDSKSRIRLYANPQSRTAVAAILAKDGARVEVVSESNGEVSEAFDVVAGARYRPVIRWIR